MIHFLLACTPAPEDSAKPDADADSDTDADSEAESVLAGFDDATLVGQEQMWTAASTPLVLLAALAPLISAQNTDDEECPVVAEDGEDVTVTGGCTDQDGVIWKGTAASGPAAVDYDAFGFDEPDGDCTGERSALVYDGTVVGERISDTELEFEIDLVGQVTGPDDACAVQDVTLALAYAGGYQLSGADNDGDGAPDVATYSGAGTYGFSHIGRASVTTKDEVLDNAACEHEAASGTTEVAASGNTIIYTYDGATDCDEAATVRWSFDGADQGELEGVSCATGAAPAWLFGVAVLFIRRR